ncbi:molybdopterin-dependent oxidoreductase, partial [Alphaproteobacteria bacterium]|nr:molybdopterin-dependent oxidoreductase [Alphaproteobacteria bacterium]
GGFGGKGSLYPEEIIVAYLSKKFKKPVKWTSDRLEDIMSTSQAFEEIIDAKLSFNSDGKFVSLEGNVIGNIGAYSIFPWTGALEPVQVIGFLPGPYDIKNFHGNVKCVVTSKSPTGPYRGVGRPAAVFVLERLVDMAAKLISMDPIEIRLKNLINSQDLPYRIGSGIIWNDAGFKECLIKAKNSELFQKMMEYKSNKKIDKWVGYGIATYAELTGIGSKISVAPGMPINTGSETATIEIDGTGSVTGTFAIASHGQGLETTLAQIIADELGVKPDDVKVIHGDTAKAKHGTGTYASRSAVIGGGAAIKSVRTLKNKILKVAAHLFNTDPNNIQIEDGIISSLNTNKSINFSELAEAVYSDMETLPVELRESLNATESYDPIYGATTTATHIALVEIDKQTFNIKVLKYIVSEDCGKVINPLIVDGQVHGGVAQGIGVALLEELNYDEEGQLTTANLVDYKIPTASEIPKIDIFHLENFLPDNIGKFKGMGEGGTIGAPAAIANAVADALSEYQIEINELPINQERLYHLLKNKL